MSSNTESFTINETGENTGKLYKGVFKTKIRLGHRAQLRQDEMRRDLLGAKPDGASPRAVNLADIFSFIWAHLEEAPQWWTMENNGIDLEDDVVPAAVYRAIVDLKVAAAGKLKKEAEDATKVLTAESK